MLRDLKQYGLQLLESYLFITMFSLFVIQTYIEEMTEEAYQKHVTALALRRLEKPKKLISEANRHWSEIKCGHYNFDRGKLNVVSIHARGALPSTVNVEIFALH